MEVVCRAKAVRTAFSPGVREHRRRRVHAEAAARGPRDHRLAGETWLRVTASPPRRASAAARVAWPAACRPLGKAALRPHGSGVPGQRPVRLPCPARCDRRPGLYLRQGARRHRGAPASGLRGALARGHPGGRRHGRPPGAQSRAPGRVVSASTMGALSDAPPARQACRCHPIGSPCRQPQGSSGGGSRGCTGLRVRGRRGDRHREGGRDPRGAGPTQPAAEARARSRTSTAGGAVRAARRAKEVRSLFSPRLRECGRRRGDAAASVGGRARAVRHAITRTQSAGSPPRRAGASPRPRRPSSPTAASIWTACWSLRGTASSRSLTSGSQRAPGPRARLRRGARARGPADMPVLLLVGPREPRGAQLAFCAALYEALAGVPTTYRPREPQPKASPRLLPAAR
jgi:hypothetical protein